MPWFKVDDKTWGHPKWLAASPGARALWVTAGSWCADQLQDGAIPAHVLPMLGGRPRDAAELVRIGLWEATEAGWCFHDWAEYQPSRDQVHAERHAARERQRRARDKAKSQRESRRDNTVSHAERAPTSRRESRSPRPDPTLLPQADASGRADAAAPTSTPPPDVLVDVEAPPASPTRRAQTLAKHWHELVPMSKFPAVMAICRRALDAGHGDNAIAAALDRLAGENRSLTLETLRVELEGSAPTRQGRAAPGEEMAQTLEIGRRLQAEHDAHLAALEA